MRGISHVGDQAAVVGKNDNNGPGVLGFSGRVGVWGESTDWLGVFGYSKSGHGILGESPNGSGVIGVAKRWHGIYGVTESTVGGVGIWGEHKTTGTGIVGYSASGIGIHGIGGRLAGRFDGDVEITGDIRLLNVDCAEDFTIGLDSAVDPGTVMVVGEDGELFPCQETYDKRVASWKIDCSVMDGVWSRATFDDYETSIRLSGYRCRSKVSEGGYNWLYMDSAGYLNKRCEGDFEVKTCQAP